MNAIGIIGGGQLGLMLIQNGIRKLDKNVSIYVLSNTEHCSVSTLTEHDKNITIVIGDLHDSLTVNNFIAKCDVVTWETEHFNTDIDIESNDKCIPNISILKTINNKITQKNFYTATNTPTVPYVTSSNELEIRDDLFVRKSDNMYFGTSVVVKQPLGGYDGKSVDIISAGDHELIQNVLIEKYISSKTEVSVIVVVDYNGKMFTYEPIKMTFHWSHNILDQCYPVSDSDSNSNSNSNSNSEKPMKDLAVQCALDVVRNLIKSAGKLTPGVFAVEMFYDNNGKIYVNEIAPRVHNSGHHTIDTCDISQFEMLARLLLGYPVRSPIQMVKYYVMRNLLGPVEITGKCYIQNKLGVLRESPKLHNYYKKNSTPFRKIGHITHISSISQEYAKRECNTYSRLVSVVIGSSPVVGIVMGSINDNYVMSSACDILTELGIPYEMTIVSAHRTPDRLSDYGRTAKSRGLKVIIAGAGGAAHLPGMLAANTLIPVIGVPIKSAALNGVDSLHSIVQMPQGVPVACMSIDGAANAALYAAQILALTNPIVYEKIQAYRCNMREKVYDFAESNTFIRI